MANQITNRQTAYSMEGYHHVEPLNEVEHYECGGQCSCSKNT